MTVSRSYLLLASYMITLCAMPAWANINTSGLKLSAYGGVQYSDIDPSSFTLIGNQIEKIAPHQRHTYDDTWGVGAGYRIIPASQNGIFHYAHDITLGVDAMYFQTQQQGDTLDYAVFENFDYQLKVSSWRFLANIEWTFPALGPCVYPFIVGGLGLASNSASYSDIPDSDAITSIGITIPNTSSTDFAFDMGAGIKIMASNNLELSFRYLYLDAGTAVTSHHASLPITSPIKIPLASQSLIAGLSYLF